MATQLAFWEPQSDRSLEQLSQPVLVNKPPTCKPPGSESPVSKSTVEPPSVLQQLRRQVQRLEHHRPVQAALPPTSCGGAALDRLLPQGGLPPAAVTEWIAAAPGGGARLLAMLAAAEIVKARRGWLVVVDSAGSFYPPAALSLGIDPDRIVWVRPHDRSDQVWAIDQALRCPAVAAVWSPLGAWLDDRDARRFQLAAEAGNTVGLLVRPAAVMGQPSFAEIRWHVRGVAPVNAALSQNPPQTELPSLQAMRGRVLQATLARCRGGQVERSAVFTITEHGTIDDQAHASFASPVAASNPATNVHLAAQLAHPTVERRRRTSA